MAGVSASTEMWATSLAAGEGEYCRLWGVSDTSRTAPDSFKYTWVAVRCRRPQALFPGGSQPRRSSSCSTRKKERRLQEIESG